MQCSKSKRRRMGAISARDALVFVVVALVALVLIEGIIISNAAAPPGTQTYTQTYYDTVNGNATTVTLQQGPTVTVGGSGSTVTSTVTSTYDPGAKTITSTVTSTTTSTVTGYMVGPTQTVTATSTQTETDTSTVTSTVTITSSSGTNPATSYVIIPPGTSSSGQTSGGYDPDKITVQLGVNNTVTWINGDSVAHSVTSTSGNQPFNSGNIPPQGSFTYTFTVPGDYTYVCVDFPWMSGVVTVIPASN